MSLISHGTQERHIVDGVTYRTFAEAEIVAKAQNPRLRIESIKVPAFFVGRGKCHRTFDTLEQAETFMNDTRFRRADSPDETHRVHSIDYIYRDRESGNLLSDTAHIINIDNDLFSSAVANFIVTKMERRGTVLDWTLSEADRTSYASENEAPEFIFIDNDGLVVY